MEEECQRLREQLKSPSKRPREDSFSYGHDLEGVTPRKRPYPESKTLVDVMTGVEQRSPVIMEDEVEVPESLSGVMFTSGGSQRKQGPVSKV